MLGVVRQGSGESCVRVGSLCFGGSSNRCATESNVVSRIRDRVVVVVCAGAISQGGEGETRSD